jgi:hypothetical protein
LKITRAWGSPSATGIAATAWIEGGSAADHNREIDWRAAPTQQRKLTLWYAGDGQIAASQQTT